MEIILYITGGIALLALAWFLISLAGTVKALRGVISESQAMITEARNDVHVMTETITEIKTQVVPILGNVTELTYKVNSIADGVQGQLDSIRDTVDDTLDVVRGTIDDVERLKNELVATVEGPVRLVQSSVGGAVGAIKAGANLLTKLVGKSKKDESKMGGPDIAVSANVKTGSASMNGTHEAAKVR